MKLVLDTRGGLGDNLYARPFVRAYAATHNQDVIVRSPWPQLFRDFAVSFQQPGGAPLRTQNKNLQRTPRELWGPAYMPHVQLKRFEYRLEVPGRSIVQELVDTVGWPAAEPFVFDAPTFEMSPLVPKAARLALVRPVTIRHEWPNRARNPNPRYIASAAELLRDAGYHVVVVGDVDPRHEPAVDVLPAGDTMLVRGQLTVEPLLALVQRADVVVGGVGWIVPAVMAYGTPAIIIGGGNGGHNAPERLTDRRVDCSRIRFLLPNHYCRCTNMRHGCMKAIPDFEERFLDALDEIEQDIEVAA